MTTPAVFVSHGAPTFAIEPGLAGAQLAALGRAIGKVRAIVILSPHWMTRGVEVSAAANPATIHDFGGFPQALYELSYSPPGAPGVAARVVELLREGGVDAATNSGQGLDHGAWVPLMHMFPHADVPVVQVSMPMRLDSQAAFRLGRLLAPLREENVLVIGSGSLTHNLYEFRSGEVGEAAYAREFTQWIREAVLAGDTERLVSALDHAPHAKRAHPTIEHFVPLSFALGASGGSLPATVLDGGIRHGVLAMESYAFGQSFTLDPLPNSTSATHNR